jgi:hypothetical protein
MPASETDKSALSEVIPPRLYKYRSLSPAHLRFTEQIFVRNELYFSPLGTLNDPSEGEHTSYFPAFNDPVMSDPDVQEMLGAEFLKGQTDLETIKSAIGVCSLSERADDPVMWSHYADGHRGICLEFDGAAIQNAFPETHRVIYSDSEPRIAVFGPATDSMEHAKQFCLSKTEQWQYEKEWRALSPTSGPKAMTGAALTGVILGARVASDDRRRVVDWLALRVPPPRLLKAEIFRYKLSISSICAYSGDREQLVRSIVNTRSAGS